MKISPEFFKNFQVNIQILAPKIMHIFKDFFVDFEDSQEQVALANSNKLELKVLGLENDLIREE